MKQSFKKIREGYEKFREKYVHGDQSIMQSLSKYGQNPQTMVVACCDSRVDPALLLQCDPGDLFVVRNVANIVPPYEKDEAHHGTSAALEFGVRFLKVKQLILLGHSQCGGIQALLSGESEQQNDFINNWVSLIKTPDTKTHDCDAYAKVALNRSYENCLTFPWIASAIENDALTIHRWYFDIQAGKIFAYSDEMKTYQAL